MMSGGCDAEMRVGCVDRLARIEQILQDRMEHAHEDRERMEAILFRHEDQILALEKWRNWMLGACGVLSAFALGIGQWVRNHLQFQL